MYKTVAECYEGQSVFMTGGTGFLGKVVLEKLLYSCPGLENVYILVRERKNESAQKRIQNMLEEPPFARLRNEKPEVFKKIVPIVGDISEPKLGIKAEDEELLINKVSLVFHVAATVKFNEVLDVAMNINVSGTERALNLSQRMKNIKSFVYVSTAYSNTDRYVVEEVVYPAPASLDEVKKLIKFGISDGDVKDLLKSRPNTYTFTKALAEHVVAKNHGNVPSIIIRPSIVSSGKSEPMVGWIDNWFGATGLISTITKGYNRVLLGRSTNYLDLIPVDYVSNLIIVAAAKSECTSGDVSVYNCCTSGENPITIGSIVERIIDDSCKHKANDVPIPFLFFTRFKWMVALLTLILQTIPGYIADTFLRLRGKNVMFSRIYAKVFFVRDTVEYFTSRSWIILASKTRALADSLSPSDKEIFPCNPMDIDWEEYMPIYCYGIREFLSKKNLIY